MVGLHYKFYQQSDISTYVVDLLPKNKYLCNYIKNVGNWKYIWANVSNKTIGLRAIFSPYCCWYHSNFFYKATCNARLAFNSINVKGYNVFYIRMLILLFTIIHCSISEYQRENKVVRLFGGKIAQNLYCYI